MVKQLIARLDDEVCEVRGAVARAAGEGDAESAWLAADRWRKLGAAVALARQLERALDDLGLLLEGIETGAPLADALPSVLPEPVVCQATIELGPDEVLEVPGAEPALVDDAEAEAPSSSERPQGDDDAADATPADSTEQELETADLPSLSVPAAASTAHELVTADRPSLSVPAAASTEQELETADLPPPAESTADSSEPPVSFGEPDDPKLPVGWVQLDPTLAERYDAWRHEMTAQLDQTERSGSAVAKVKSLVCQGRAFVGRGPGQRVVAGVDIELDLARGWLTKAGHGRFRCLDSNGLPADAWEELALAYAWMADAEALVAEIEQEKPPFTPQLGEVLRHAGAAQAWVWRLTNGRHDDRQVDELHHRIAALTDGRDYIPYWNMQPGKKVPDPDVRAAAHGVATALQRWQQTLLPQMRAKLEAEAQRAVKKEQCEAAMVNLDVAITNQRGDDVIADAIEEAIEAGVPASDKRLRAWVRPYGNLLRDSSNKKLRRLKEYLDQDSMVIGPDEPADEPDEDGPELLNKISQLEPLLKGKTMLLMGGNKGQTQRRGQYERRLGLKELIWPDSESTDGPAFFDAAMRRADIVVHIIKFSRHSYNEVAREAKKLGKKSVKVKAGYSLTALVHAFEEQLVPSLAKTARTAG